MTNGEQHGDTVMRDPQLANELEHGAGDRIVAPADDGTFEVLDGNEVVLRNRLDLKQAHDIARNGADENDGRLLYRRQDGTVEPYNELNGVT